MKGIALALLGLIVSLGAQAHENKFERVVVNIVAQENANTGETDLPYFRIVEVGGDRARVEKCATSGPCQIVQKEQRIQVLADTLQFNLQKISGSRFVIALQDMAPELAGREGEVALFGALVSAGIAPGIAICIYANGIKNCTQNTQEAVNRILLAKRNDSDPRDVPSIQVKSFRILNLMFGLK